jgi:nicotinate-nucleotide adenylyltransferase
MKRVALFGGSFNPPHVAHQLAALYVLETQPVDELWFVPVWKHVFGKPLAPYDARVEMCELAAAPLGVRAKVSRVEEELGRRPEFAGSRTLDLIEHLLAIDPTLQLRLVIGSDILNETASWHRWDDVVAKAPLIVLGRAGHDVGAALPAGSIATATGITLPAISSTAVRRALAALTAHQRAELVAGRTDGNVGSLLPASVLRYIANAQLYTGPA